MGSTIFLYHGLFIIIMSYFAVAASFCAIHFFLKIKRKNFKLPEKAPIQFIYGMQHSALLILKTEIQFSDIIFFFCHFSTSVHFPSSPYPNVFLSCIFWVDFFSLFASLFFVLACFPFCMFTINAIEHTETSIMMNGLTLFKRSTIKCNFLLQWCNFCISIEFCTILFYFH